MPIRDELLNDIPGPKPGGVDLRDDPFFEKIKEAAREDDDLPQGDYVSKRKVADWGQVISLAKEALTTKTKDLEIAAMLTQALLRREGFAGLWAGFDIITGLVDKHWDHLYPEIEDGDAEYRAAQLARLVTRLDVPLRLVPIDKAGYNTLQHKDARLMPTEADAAADSAKAAQRQAAIDAGKKTPEEIDSAFLSTPKPFMKALVADIEGALGALKSLNAVSQEKFGDVAPSFGKLREGIEDVHRIATQQLKHKLEIDPDPVDITATEETPAASGDGAAGGAAAGGTLSLEPASRDDAAARIVNVARYLRRNDPFNPAAYLMLRGFRWGELRASTEKLDPKLLEAPPTSIRTTLRGLLLDSKWPELLEASEGVMGTPQGRGWLDLQRYALTAVDALGSDYFAVATAMRGALKALLADLPQLLDMTLMDDTPTANAETRSWLRTQKLLHEPDVAALDGGEAAASNGGPPADDGGEPRGRDPFALAAAEVRANRVDRAIALLMGQAAREKTSRGRFLVQAQLAKIMVDAGHEAVATPILEQLIADVETHKLEDWEAGELVATPMALMYRVLAKTESDAGRQQSLYQQICRLDPILAISFSQS